MASIDDPRKLKFTIDLPDKLTTPNAVAELDDKLSCRHLERRHFPPPVPHLEPLGAASLSPGGNFASMESLRCAQ